MVLTATVSNLYTIAIFLSVDGFTKPRKTRSGFHIKYLRYLLRIKKTCTCAIVQVVDIVDIIATTCTAVGKLNKSPP